MTLVLPHRPSARRKSSTRILRRALAEAGEHYERGSAPTVGHLILPLGAEATALAAALLALPFLSPVSLGPITTPTSVLIGLLGWQLLRQQEGAALPQRLMDVTVPQAGHRVMTSVLRRGHRLLHLISRPRLASLVLGDRGRVVCGVGIVAGAILLAVPIPLLPLTNTFPALGILLVALGRLERDGLLTLLGSASLLLAVAIFGALGAVVALFGWEAAQGLSQFISPAAARS